GGSHPVRVQAARRPRARDPRGRAEERRGPERDRGGADPQGPRQEVTPMAIKATIFKAELQVSDLDRGHFATHALTIARHPSETDERMMVRVLAFALNADDALEFGRGLSS